MLALLALPGRGVSQTGTVGGLVHNRMGKAIPDALVVLSDDRFTAKSDSLGRFLLPHVPAGTYQLFVVKGWFIPRVVRDLSVRSGKMVFVDIKLATTTEEEFDKRFRMPMYIPDSSIQYR